MTCHGLRLADGTEFIKNAIAAFGGSTERTEQEIKAERDHHLRKIGELEMKMDFAKRASKASGETDAHRRLVSPDNTPSLSSHLDLLGISMGLHNTLDEEDRIEVLRLAVEAHGASEIINSD